MLQAENMTASSLTSKVSFTQGCGSVGAQSLGHLVDRARLESD
jgi:hypothetical protein